MSDILSTILRYSTIEELEWIRDEVGHELRRRGRPSVEVAPICGAYAQHGLGPDGKGCPQAPGHEGNHGVKEHCPIRLAGNECLAHPDGTLHPPAPRCAKCKDRGGYCVYCWEGDLAPTEPAPGTFGGKCICTGDSDCECDCFNCQSHQ